MNRSIFPGDSPGTALFALLLRSAWFLFPCALFANEFSASGQIEVGEGWHSNPLLLQNADTLKQSAWMTTLGAEGRAEWRPGDFQFSGQAGVSSEMFRKMDRAGDEEARLQLDAKLAGKDGLRPFVGVGAKGLASNNCILEGSERFYADGLRQGVLDEKVWTEVGIRPRAAGRIRMTATLRRRDFEEMQFQTASLDRDQWLYSIDWKAPRIVWITPSIQFDVERKEYREWPARDLLGHVINGDSKSYRTIGGEGSILIEPTSSLQIEPGFRYTHRTDRISGYFNLDTYSPSISVEYAPDSLWRFSAKAHETWEFYQHYRDRYSSKRGLKRIRLDSWQGMVERNFGWFDLQARVVHKAEDNTSEKYTWSVWRYELRVVRYF